MWQETGQEYNRLCWIAEKDDRLKEILLNEMGVSVRLMVALKKDAYIKVNGKRKTVNEQVQAGDLIEVTLPEEASEYMPQDIPLHIHYEDADLLVVEKPYDMVVHPTKNHLYDTMLNAILYYFKKHNIHAKPRFVNRLDRYTSGVLIVAKSQFAHSFMSRDNSLWDMDKEYIAVVEGKLTGSGTITGKIGKSEEGIRREIRQDGQDATTHYEVIAETQEASFVKVRLETGRTHQIRVHMTSIGHPLFGDALYGGRTDLIGRQALHAAKLGFQCPRKKEKQEIKIKLPDDIRELLETLFKAKDQDRIKNELQ